MAIISLKSGSIVYHKGVKHEIVKPVDHAKVLIRSHDNGETRVVKIDELSAIPPGTEVPTILSADLPPRFLQIALKRLEIITPLLVPLRTRAMVEQRAAEFGNNAVTLYRWIDRYEATKSLTSLAPAYDGRGGKGKGRLDPAVEAILSEVIEKQYLTNQKKSIDEVYELASQMCRRAGLPLPAKNTFKNRVKKLSQKTAAGVREGEKAAQRFEPIKGNFPGALYPLATVQIDHTPLDVMVVDELYRKPIGRPWLTLAIDVNSRMVFGFFISLDRPSFFSVGQTLLMGILPKDSFLKEHDIAVPWEIQGLPKIIHADNAGEFNAEDFLLFCKENNLEINWRPLKRPQYGGHIERLAGTLNKKIHALPGTTFSNTKERGEYDSEGKACFTITELERWFAVLVLEIYHNERHSALGMSPRQQYEIGVFGDETTPGSGLPDIIEDAQRLRLSLLPSFSRTVQRDGVSLDGITYFHDCLRQWVNVKDDSGLKKALSFRRDPRDISVLYFYDPVLEDHFTIPYRDFRRPPMSIWDLRNVKRHLREKGINDANEHQIFLAREKQQQMEREAAEKTKTARRAQEASRHRARTLKKDKQTVPLKAQGVGGSPTQGPSALDAIFADVEPFGGIEVVGKKEE